MSASAVSGEAFRLLATAPGDTDFEGVAFAPNPLPATLPLLLSGLFGLGSAFRLRLTQYKGPEKHLDVTPKLRADIFQS